MEKIPIYYKERDIKSTSEVGSWQCEKGSLVTVVMGIRTQTCLQTVRFWVL
jgi:hypothetical protein